MRSFLKIFLASFLALVVFVIVFFFFSVGYISGVVQGIASTHNDEVGSKGVLILDLGESFGEKSTSDLLAGFSDTRYNTPGVFDVIRMIHYAKTDSAIKGIYIKSNANNNGLGTTEEIRNELLDFKKSGKFIYAYGDVISLKAFYAASIADRIYCNPKGGVEWKGLTTVMEFFKGGLDKLEIQPEIFYAGKFKSYTEPFRADKMSDANRLQLTVILSNIFNHILDQTATARQQDSAVLRRCVDEHLIQTGSDALKFKLVDGLKYNDQVLEEVAEKTKASSISNINFIPLGKYFESVSSKLKGTGSERIAVIYAEGDIVGGKNSQKEIGQDVYRQIIRKVRLDNDVKAIVIRINSGGGSGLVSENLWRELTLAKADKPVVVSFGDVSASGAYYLSCSADSIFSDPMTITGSIGVFTMLFNTQSFFKNKLGITFDAVHTAKEPDAITLFQPLTDMQKKFIQNGVDSFYQSFLTRVADGRKKEIPYIDSIAQGRIWSGEQGLQLGLVDRIGGIQDALDCSARLAKLKSYRLVEYPEPENFLDLLLNNYKQSAKEKSIREDLGDQGAYWYSMMQNYKSVSGIPQTRLPFQFSLVP
jgi:protease IV